MNSKMVSMIFIIFHSIEKVHTMDRQLCGRERHPGVFPASVGVFCLKRPLKFQFTYFSDEMPPQKLERPRGSFQGVFSCHIIDIHIVYVCLSSLLTNRYILLIFSGNSLDY